MNFIKESIVYNSSTFLRHKIIFTFASQNNEKFKRVFTLPRHLITLLFVKDFVLYFSFYLSTCFEFILSRCTMHLCSLELFFYTWLTTLREIRCWVLDRNNQINPRHKCYINWLFLRDFLAERGVCYFLVWISVHF